VEAIDRGWDGLGTGEWIALRKRRDKNMRYQQNLTDWQIAFIVIGNQQWPVLLITWIGS
jgi:hypothetical protein